MSEDHLEPENKTMPPYTDQKYLELEKSALDAWLAVEQ